MSRDGLGVSREFRCSVTFSQFTRFPALRLRPVSVLKVRGVKIALGHGVFSCVFGVLAPENADFSCSASVRRSELMRRLGIKALHLKESTSKHHLAQHMLSKVRALTPGGSEQWAGNTVFDYVRADIRALTHSKTGILAKLVVVLFHAGLHAVLLYRAARWFHLHYLPPLAVLTSYFGSVLTGSQISARADIGKGLVIYHPHGIAVGETAVIGEYCTLTHGNLIGQLHGGDDRPVIGNYFVAGTGAKILGRIRIGDRVRVGPNAVVTRSLPDGLTVAGNPARIIRDRGSPDRESTARIAAQVDSPNSNAAVMRRLVRVITSSAKLATARKTIGKDTVLLGQGIGLDSIEILHVISGVEEEFGLTIDESDLKTWHLQTVKSLATFIGERLSG